MAHSCQSLDLLSPCHDSCQTACSPIDNGTTSSFGHSSAMDRNIPPLHLPCCIKVPRMSANTWSSTISAYSSNILLAWLVHLIPTIVRIEAEDSRDGNSYQIKADSSKQGVSEGLWRRIQATV